MKKFLFALLIVTSFSCNKNKDSVSQENCEWFPIYKQTSLVYNTSTYIIGSQTTARGTITANTSNKNTLDIDGYKFTLSDCSNGKINMSFGSNVNNMLAIDKKAASETVLSSNSSGKFEKRILAGENVYTYTVTNSPNVNIIIVYKENKGITSLLTTMGGIQKDYYLQ